MGQVSLVVGKRSNGSGLFGCMYKAVHRRESTVREQAEFVLFAGGRSWREGFAGVRPGIRDSNKTTVPGMNGTVEIVYVRRLILD
jgi:hypothetical protein